MRKYPVKVGLVYYTMLDASFQSSYRNETTPRGTHLSEIYRSTSQNYNVREGNDDDAPLSGIIPLSKLLIYLQYLQLFYKITCCLTDFCYTKKSVFSPQRPRCSLVNTKKSRPLGRLNADVLHLLASGKI